MRCNRALRFAVDHGRNGGKVNAIMDCPTCSKNADEILEKYAVQGLTLATLCDIVLGEDAEDRSDEELVRVVANLMRSKLTAE